MESVWQPHRHVSSCVDNVFRGNTYFYLKNRILSHCSLQQEQYCSYAYSDSGANNQKIQIILV